MSSISQQVCADDRTQGNPLKRQGRLIVALPIFLLALVAGYSQASGATPTITGLSQSSGPVGTLITITGTNFGATQGTSTVAITFGRIVTPTSWSATSITAPVPSAGGGGTIDNIVVTVGGVASNGVPFSITPFITSVSPASGPVGTVVTITGTSFGRIQGDIQTLVTFNGTSAGFLGTWSDTKLVVAVPAGATTGNVLVTVLGFASNGVKFTVTPATGGITRVQHVSQDAGTTNTTTLTFPYPNTPGNFIAVAIRAGNSSSQVFTVSDSNGNTYHQATQLGQIAGQETLAIYYAENIKPGKLTLAALNIVSVSDTLSATLRVAILEYSGIVTANSLDAPAQGQGNSTSPSSGNLTTLSSVDLVLGAIETTNPANFTAGGGNAIVESVPAEPNTKLIVEDQILTSAGYTSASASLGASDNWGALLATFKGVAGIPPPNAPTVTRVGPSSGPVGTPITITGTNFGANQSNSTVTFNGTAAVPTNWSATSITAPVPAGATPGKVVVTVGAVASNGVFFTVTATGPTITGLSQTSGPVGTPITITGTNFGATQGNSTVTINSVRASPTSWSTTSVTAPVPSGNTVGSIVVTVGGIASNGIGFTITSSVPNITSVSPTSGPVGTVFTITGTNFGSTQGDFETFVTLDGKNAGFNGPWSNTKIVEAVPAGATTGNVVVTSFGVASNGVNFTVTPATGGITLVQHVSQDAGTTGATSLTFPYPNTRRNWIAVVIRAGNSASQKFTVSDSAGNTYQRAVQLGQTTGQETLAIFYAENISDRNYGALNAVSVSDTLAAPLRVAILEYSGVTPALSLDVTATGQGNSKAPNSGNASTTTSIDLLLGAVETANPASIAAGSGYTIEESVPAEPNTKLIVEDQILTSAAVVSANASLATSDNWGAVLAAFKGCGSVPSGPPTITSLSQASGTVGTPVTITGTNFGGCQGSSAVNFAGGGATPTSWNATSIVVPVPAGAVTGDVLVSVAALSSNAVVFTVLP
jgi:hypothetical protein